MATFHPKKEKKKNKTKATPTKSLKLRDRSSPRISLKPKQLSELTQLFCHGYFEKAKQYMDTARAYKKKNPENNNEKKYKRRKRKKTNRNETKCGRCQRAPVRPVYPFHRIASHRIVHPFRFVRWHAIRMLPRQRTPTATTRKRLCHAFGAPCPMFHVHV